MAGEWIKMRNDLSTSPKVVRIASALHSDRLRVIGGLHAVWCLFDVHSEDGLLEGYTTQTLDEMIGWTGFGAAMCDVDWLAEGPYALAVPRFDEHNGQSAKRRAQEALRKRTDRRNAYASDADKKRSKGEERRGERKNPPTPLPGGFVAFWKAWPDNQRKAAKPQCLRKWESKGCEAMADRVVAAVNAAKQSPDWLKDAGAMIPAPLVWLNQERWEAPIAAAPAPLVPLFVPKPQMTPEEREANAEAARRALKRVTA